MIWRRGCEACHADSEPCPDVYHAEIHRLMDAIEAAESKTEPDNIEDVIDELQRASNAIEDALYAAERLVRPRKKAA